MFFKAAPALVSLPTVPSSGEREGEGEGEGVVEVFE